MNFMIIDQLKDFLGARPFRPFVICLSDGHQVPVRHPEFMAISPGGSTAMVYTKDEAAEILQLVQVTRVLVDNEPSVPDRN